MSLRIKIKLLDKLHAKHFVIRVIHQKATKSGLLRSLYLNFGIGDTSVRKNLKNNYKV